MSSNIHKRYADRAFVASSRGTPTFDTQQQAGAVSSHVKTQLS